MAVVESSPSFLLLKVTSSLSSAASERRYQSSDTIGDLKVLIFSGHSSNKCTLTLLRQNSTTYIIYGQKLVCILYVYACNNFVGP